MKKFNELITEQYKYSDELLEVLSEYGIGVYSISEAGTKGRYSPVTLMSDEKQLKEFRVTLGKIYYEENLEEDYYTTNREDIDDRDLESFDKDVEKLGKVSNEFDDDATFSVFLPQNVKLVEKGKKNYDLFVKTCLSQAMIYFKELKNSMNQVYSKVLLNTEDMDSYPTELGQYCSIHSIQISNSNIDPLFTVMRRLYEDSKFFYTIMREIDESTYKELINDVLNIL